MFLSKHLFTQPLNRNSTVACSSNHDVHYFLRDIIAHTLYHLRKKFMTAMENFGIEVTPCMIDWVITVPAIWKADGKQMMREAAYAVSMLKALCHDISKWFVT